MPVFPSEDWCRQAISLLNADPESAEAGRGWEGDIGLVVDAEPGKLAQPFAVHCLPERGRIERVEVLEDPDDLDAIEPAYLARAPYSVWKGIIQGTVDPVEAVIRGRIHIRGDMQPIIERMRYKSLADRVLSQMRTEFVDERGGR